MNGEVRKGVRVKVGEGGREGGREGRREGVKEEVSELGKERERRSKIVGE